MRISLVAAAMIAAIILAVVPVAKAQEFVPVTDYDNPTVKAVFVGPTCSTSQSREIVPNAMFTIEPSASTSSTTMRISTTPAHLVEVLEADNAGGHKEVKSLAFRWNETTLAANVADGGEWGVKIEFPAEQLRYVAVDNRATAQVLNGFTSVQALYVQGGSTATADLESNQNLLELSVGGQSIATLKSNANVAAEVVGDSTAYVEAPLVEVWHLWNSRLSVAGSVAAGDSMHAAGTHVLGDDENYETTLIATGNVAEGRNLIANGTSTVVVGGASASGCDSVTTYETSSCAVDDTVTVNVDVSEKPATLSGAWIDAPEGCSDSKSASSSSSSSRLLPPVISTLVVFIVSTALFLC